MKTEPFFSAKFFTMEALIFVISYKPSWCKIYIVAILNITVCK